MPWREQQKSTQEDQTDAQNRPTSLKRLAKPPFAVAESTEKWEVAVATTCLPVRHVENTIWQLEMRALQTCHPTGGLRVEDVRSSDRKAAKRHCGWYTAECRSYHEL